MSFVKKSANLKADVVQRIEDFSQKNPGVTFTLIVNQALQQWLDNPRFDVAVPKAMTDDDMDQFMRDNQGLMDKLAK